MEKNSTDKRMLGVAVPVGALRGNSSMGVGEFPDLAGFACLCRKMKIKLIQILPVNDTGYESSPYSSLTAFGLHPLYLRIEDLEEYDESNSTVKTESVQNKNNTTSAKSENTSSNVQTQNNSNFNIPGRFPQASERLLSANDLSGLNESDLKIMRNEIFARHGYIFQTNDMKNHFQNQVWYRPLSNNVNSKLTNIENKNIALIRRYE